MQCECSRRPGSVPRSRRLGRTQFAPVMCSTNRFVGFDSPGILQCSEHQLRKNEYNLNTGACTRREARHGHAASGPHRLSPEPPSQRSREAAKLPTVAVLAPSSVHRAWVNCGNARGSECGQLAEVMRNIASSPQHHTKTRNTEASTRSVFYQPRHLYSSNVRLTNVAPRSTSLAKSFSNSTAVMLICPARWRTTSRHATVSSSARCAWRPQQLQIRDKHCKRAHPSARCCPQQRTTCSVST